MPTRSVTDVRYGRVDQHLTLDRVTRLVGVARSTTASRSMKTIPSSSQVPASADEMEKIMTTTENPIDNGVNVAALLEAREALGQAPEAAEFEWRASCEWIKGTHSHSKVEGYFGLGTEQMHKSEFEYDADHPETFASEDHGATPTEFMLVGLASCLTAGVASIAQHREIQLRSVKATVAGKMNVQGVLGVDPEVRNGFSDITVSFDIDADASQADLEALVAQSQKRSAVYDIITNPTNIAVEVN